MLFANIYYFYFLKMINLSNLCNKNPISIILQHLINYLFKQSKNSNTISNLEIDLKNVSKVIYIAKVFKEGQNYKEKIIEIYNKCQLLKATQLSGFFILVICFICKALTIVG